MRARFKALRFKQLSSALDRRALVGEVIRPSSGWLRALREMLGLTLRELGRRLDVSPQAVRAFEQAEATDRITLASLRRVAEVMDCELVYVLVPRDGSLQTLAEREARHDVAADVEATEHSMELEAQGSGDTEEKVRDEARRRLRGDS